MDVRGRKALVVGGGSAGLSKMRLLNRAGAEVTLVAPFADSEVANIARSGKVKWLPRPFDSGDVEGCVVVFAATGNKTVDTCVVEAASKTGIPINVVDNPHLSTFITPSIVDRDPVVIGISTGGSAPVLARRLRGSIEEMLPDRLGELASFASKFRTAVSQNIPVVARRRFWENFFDGFIASKILAGHESEAHLAMEQSIRDGSSDVCGSVSIVGAGPGRRDLLTLRALHLLQDADVVVYDRLVGPEIVDSARRDARLIDVGKMPGCHVRDQKEINVLLAHHASQGRRVVRLKGGDPLIFGRGGEELDYLYARGISVEVVPGITAALGSAAVSGIPLTHRKGVHAVTLVTGHGAVDEAGVDWADVARGAGTLVIYMGTAKAKAIASRLIEGGRKANTLVAIVERATLPGERIVEGTLGGLGELIKKHGIVAPAIIIVGDVVAARNVLKGHSFEKFERII